MPIHAELHVAARVVLATLGVRVLWVTLAGADGGDFVMFHDTARALLADGPAYPVYAREGYQLRNLNPPHFHVLLMPWLWLPFTVHLIAHQGSNVAALVWAIHLMAPPGFWRTTRAQWVGVAVLWWPAFHANLSNGQFVGWLALGVVLAYRGRDRAPWASGVLLGVLVSIKPFLGLLWVWAVARRNWPLALGAVLGGAGCTVFGVLVFGQAPYLDWFAAVRSVTWINSPISASLIRLTTVVPTWLVLILMMAVFVQTVRYRGESWSHPLTASIVLSPLGWPHYLWLLVPFLVTTRLPWLAVLLWVPVPWTLGGSVLRFAYVVGTVAIWRGVR